MHSLPCLALPCLALLCLALPCLTVSCFALPYLALLCLTVPCFALPYPALPCFALPYPALPCPHTSQPVSSEGLHVVVCLLYTTLHQVTRTDSDKGHLKDVRRGLVVFENCFRTSWNVFNHY